MWEIALLRMSEVTLWHLPANNFPEVPVPSIFGKGITKWERIFKYCLLQYGYLLSFWAWQLEHSPRNRNIFIIGWFRAVVLEAIQWNVPVVVNQSLKIILLTVRKSVPFAVFITTPTVGNIRGPMTTGTVWSVVVVKKRRLPPIVITARESVQSADIHPMNTFGSIRQEKTTTTTTDCTVHNVLQPVAKITFTVMTENVLFAVILLPMCISGNGTRTNRTIFTTISRSVPAEQHRRKIIF